MNLSCVITTGCPKQVLPFDKQSNNNLLLYCQKSLDSKCSLIENLGDILT